MDKVIYRSKRLGLEIVEHTKPIIFQGDSYLHWQMASGTSASESYIKGFSDSNFEGHFCITYRTA